MKGGKDWDRDWNDWSLHQSEAAVQKVQCVQLAQVFAQTGIRHVNFFMLDVEGGELDVLKSVDWHSVVFDVIAVETCANCPDMRPPGYLLEVKEFLASHGYVFDFDHLRNSWFHNKQSFQPNSCHHLGIPT